MTSAYRAAVVAIVLIGSGGGMAWPSDLPPDPGAAGTAALVGIDSDGDGLRDDVQRWIALQHPESGRRRAALAQYARHLQKTLAQADDRDVAWANFEAQSLIFSCMIHVGWRADESWRMGKRPGMPVLDRAMKDDERLRAVVLNTPARRDAYRRFTRNVPAGTLERPDIADGARHCDFDPEALPD